MTRFSRSAIRERFEIPDYHSVIRLDKEVRRRSELLSYETHYYICSLGRETTAKQIQEMVLGHWQMENCLHLAKDKFYGEDKHVFRVPGMGEMWTAMTGIATALVQLMYKGERTFPRNTYYESTRTLTVFANARTDMNFFVCFRRKESYTEHDAKKIWFN